MPCSRLEVIEIFRARIRHTIPDCETCDKSKLEPHFREFLDHLRAHGQIADWLYDHIEL